MGGVTPLGHVLLQQLQVGLLGEDELVRRAEAVHPVHLRMVKHFVVVGGVDKLLALHDLVLEFFKQLVAVALLEAHNRLLMVKNWVSEY